MIFSDMKPKELREVREMVGVTIPRAARTAKVSVGCMWNFEKGKSTPTEKQLKALMAFYLARINARANRMRELLGAEV
jgi:DNA-binding transcriptional regulator YiaG